MPSADLFGEALTTPTYALEGALDLQMTSRGSDLPLLTISLYYFQSDSSEARTVCCNGLRFGQSNFVPFFRELLS